MKMKIAHCRDRVDEPAEHGRQEIEEDTHRRTDQLRGEPRTYLINAFSPGSQITFSSPEIRPGLLIDH